jgi:hypothetical protein
MERPDPAPPDGQAHGVKRPFGMRLEKIILVALLVVCIFPTGLFLAFFVPLGQVPDEPAHVARIESLLHGEITGHRVPGLDLAGRPLTLSGVVINAAPFAVTQLFGAVAVGQTMTSAVQQRLDDVPWAPRLSFVYAPNTAVYFPVLYVPAALALGLARLSGLTPFGAVLAGRLANCCVYIIVATRVTLDVRSTHFADDALVGRILQRRWAADRLQLPRSRTAHTGCRPTGHILLERRCHSCLRHCREARLLAIGRVHAPALYAADRA